MIEYNYDDPPEEGGDASAPAEEPAAEPAEGEAPAEEGA